MLWIHQSARWVTLFAAGVFVSLANHAWGSQPGQVAGARVDEANYRYILDDMLYTHDGHNRGIAGAQHDLARDNIAVLMSTYGLEVTLEPFEYEGETFYNVVGTKWGTTYPDQQYVVGAHFDSINYEDLTGGGPGADDNASGVALVLEAARVLSAFESDYTIRFVAFDLEEWGWLGAFAYVIEHVGDNILAMISTDMVAHNQGGNRVHIYGRSMSNTVKYALADAGDTYTWGMAWTVLGERDASDHAPFEMAGIPSCLLIEGDKSINPYWHTLLDSVDRPDNIDYTYATRLTRVVIGFLVDQAGFDIPIPDADQDGDGDVDTEDFTAFAACFAGPGVSVIPPCDFFDLDQDGDVDCQDWVAFEVVRTEPDAPPVFRACPPVLLRPMPEDSGCRCLSVAVQEHPWPIALLVSGDPDDADVSCLSHYVQGNGRLGTTPVFQTSDAWGTVSICDERIVPDKPYRVQCDYGEPGSPLLSVANPAVTSAWADTVGDFAEGQWTRPNGTVDFNDISAVVDAFRHLPSAPAAYRAALVGPSGNECSTDLIIDFLDISGAVEAFRGRSYYEITGCPPTCE